MVVSDPLLNSVFDGRYLIIRKLGTGGMANVYLAEDQELGRRVASKILDARHAQDVQFVERFRREATNAAGLSHPNIVSIYDRGEAEGTYYIAMEYLDGRTLKELILRRGPAPVKTAIEYTRQILAALRFAHKNGIVHRDIKPHNVLVDSEGRLKVTDFGIARAGASQMTEAGSIIGTAQYLSPEQAKGAPVDQTSDIYSVGIVLYELLTGTVPYTGDTPVEIAMKHLSQVPEPPSTLQPQIPHELDSIVLRALAKDPADRYQSADEMDADLERAANGLPVSPATEEAATMVLSAADTETMAALQNARVQPPRGPVFYDEPPRRKRSVWPWLVALLLVAAAAVAGWYVYMQIQDQLKSNQPVAVENYVGLHESDAVFKIRERGLTPQVVRRPNDTQPETIVYQQTPPPGNRIDKGNTVTIYVSTGKPKVVVPDVKGKSSVDAVQALAEAGLKSKLVTVASSQPADTVTAQDPKAGAKVVEGTVVRVNISKGPTQVGVPLVVGEMYNQAATQLQGMGFAVARQDVASSQPTGTVISQSPTGGVAAPAGSTVTLSVSLGPPASPVPDVTSLDQTAATATLQAAGYVAKVVTQSTTDPGQDGIVLSQSPQGGATAKAGSTVTIFVGSLTQ
ncbi:MAG: Stk1 family PASTA domain-containing Ser/Thr kinase [Gaiellaceae bacterium]